MDYQVPQVLMERMEAQVRRDHLVNLEREAYLVQLVTQVKMEHRVLLELEDCLE